ncbi:MAG: DEAD/DEAH box helicase [Nanoarchaeota archaeon]|nr:DEAD/DEAH box helicase [Nanoarchaeota archaeon]
MENIIVEVSSKFKELGLNNKILKVIEELKFKEPSEIQEKSIPTILQGKDVIGKSATGSGKTLAFAAGIIEKIQAGKGIQALILTPTRELAEQVSKSFKLFSKYYQANVLEVYGGVSINPQIENLRDAEIVVGTPGRILDHLERRTLDLSKVRFLVLDEADRMLDMGFIEDVQKIIELCPQERQTLLFSATISPDIENIANHYMKHPEYVEVASHVDPTKLKQVLYDVPNNLKFSLLVHLLKQEREGLVMVFCNTRRNADMIEKNLRRYALNAVVIHGGLAQNRRNAIMGQFHSGEVGILICTDVAARGLDIKGVSHIYNYDSPGSSTDYIHRIGRTARAGKEGKAINLVSPRDFANFRRVCEGIPFSITHEPIPQNLEPLAVRFEMSGREGRSGGFRSGGFRGRSSSGFRGRSDRGDSGDGDRRSGGFRPRSSYGHGGSRGGRSSGQYGRR